MRKIHAESHVERIKLKRRTEKFGGRYQNQVPSDLGACPGISRKSIAFDQVRMIPGSDLGVGFGLDGY